MTVNIDVTLDVRDAERWLSRTQRRIIPRAVSSALNKTAVTGRNEAAKRLKREMGQVSGLSSRGFKHAIEIKRSTPRTLTATIRTKGRSIPLIQFKARQTRKGVTAVAWGKRKLYKGVFIARASRGKTKKTVFKRVGKNRGRIRTVQKGQYVGRRYRPQYRIKQLYGPSIADVFEDPAIFGLIRDVVIEKFPVNFNREIAFRLRY